MAKPSTHSPHGTTRSALSTVFSTVSPPDLKKSEGTLPPLDYDKPISILYIENAGAGVCSRATELAGRLSSFPVEDAQIP